MVSAVDHNPFRLAFFKMTECHLQHRCVVSLCALLLVVLMQSQVALAKDNGFRVGVRFLDPTSVEVRWESVQAGPSSVAFGLTRELGEIVESVENGTSHRVVLNDLQLGQTYYYRIGTVQDGKLLLSPFFEFDMRMNYAPPLITSFNGTDRQTAEGLVSDDILDVLIKQLNHAGGFAIVGQDQSKSWAEALAVRTAMTVIASCWDESEMQRLRKRWYEAGVYGVRLTAQQASDVPDDFANLVVCSASTVSNYRRFVAKSGTLVCVGKPPSDAGGEWTALGAGLWFQNLNKVSELAEWGHQYGSPANQSFVGESLGGADEAGELEVRWLGRPGADFGIDRNPRMPAPLAVGGRLFHQGMNRMVALDAFNGAILWSLEIPDLRRVNIPRDCGNWCADRDRVYAATHNCLWIIDAASGEMLNTLRLPEPFDAGHEWGFVAVTDDMVFGSAVKGESIYEDYWQKAAWYDGKDDAATAKICADSIIAYDKKYGDVLWQYDMDAGVQATITIVKDSIYFVEVNDPKLRSSKSGKLKNQQIWKDASVVCLDRKTGKPRWKKPVASQADDQVVAFGLADDEQFVLQSSSGNQFHFASYAAGTGEPLWSRDVNWPENHHGAHMQHAVLMGGKLFVQPHILDATTGKTIQTGTLGKRRGCATPIGTGEAILYRGGTGPLSLWSIEQGKRTEFTRLRPSCWLSTIPAQGMLFSPEAGGGCSCGGWMECSIGFGPRRPALVPVQSRGINGQQGVGK
ncbi:MAG: PQQ-binding-like beta-propeller repeat protein [Rubripirellula sp.]|nr:PQQ-binding-like beta-propeller repeat protein [Rubripirellula sp.]